MEYPGPPDDLHDSEQLSRPRRPVWLALLAFVLAAVLALLFFGAPQLAGVFLSVSRDSQSQAFVELLASAVDESVLELLPTYTPLRTYTPRPTFTPMPSQTPRPTYTPFPTATDTASPTNTPIPTPIPPAAIIRRLRAVAQPIVLRSEFSEPALHVGIEAGLCSYGVDFAVFGIIEAGIDPQSIRLDSLSYDAASQSYSLLLSAPAFTACRIVFSHPIEKSFSVCGRDTVRERSLAEVQAIRDFIKRSADNGLLAKAEARAAETLADLAGALAGKPVIVSFDSQPESASLDASCQPTPPPGWRYDNADEVWRKQIAD